MRFNEIEYAEFYHRQMVESGYPGKLLPFVMKELEGSSTIIDIGSGTGFFSIPLAEAGYRITAVEPSVKMINIMKKNSAPEILSSIEVSPTVWESSEAEFHDAAISIHSLYPMKDIKKGITLMNKSALKKIIIVRDTGGMRTLSGLVRVKLGVSSNRDLNNEIIDILNELSVNWRAEKIFEERKHIIRDIGLEADSILYQLKLDESFRSGIIKIMNEEINNINKTSFFNAIYSDNAYIF